MNPNDSIDTCQEHDLFIIENIVPVLMHTIPHTWMEIYSWLNLSMYTITYFLLGPEGKPIKFTKDTIKNNQRLIGK